MRRPRMTKDIASGLLAIEKIYDVIVDGTFGDMYEEMLKEAEDGVQSGKYEGVPFLNIESARDYIFDLNEYYDRSDDT